MARATTATAPDNSTDANIRAWAAMIPAILTAGGFVQTADTGQTDFSTLVAPTTTNQVKGYQIWRSADATGGLNNYYVKIEVGSAAVANRPGIWVTFGWGSDGAGNLTGNTSARTQLGPTAQTSTGVNSNLWANSGAFVMSLFTDSNTNYFMIIEVERVRDNTGAKTDEIYIWLASTVGNYSVSLPRAGAVPTSSTDKTIGQRNIPSNMAQYDGSNFGISTIAPIKGVAQMEAGNIFGADSTNFSAGQSQHTIQVYGETRTYILSTNPNIWAANYRLLSRYDT